MSLFDSDLDHVITTFGITLSNLRIPGIILHSLEHILGITQAITPALFRGQGDPNRVGHVMLLYETGEVPLWGDVTPEDAWGVAREFLLVSRRIVSSFLSLFLEYKGEIRR